jgi:hypothetical protein
MNLFGLQSLQTLPLHLRSGCRQSSEDSSRGRIAEVVVECVAVLATASGLIFAGFARIQELNPFLWGLLGIVVYAATPMLMIWRGASWMDAPLVWLSSLGGLFVLFVVQSVVAARARRRRR